jgi:hypothetical protein
VWWDLLERAAGPLGNGHLPGFDELVSQVAELLSFKDLPLPEGAWCDVVVSNLGQQFVSPGPQTSRPLGLQSSLATQAPWPLAEEQRWPRLWGGINLGDEPTSVVLINLPCHQVAVELHSRFPDQASPATIGELVGRFLRTCPDYPPVRMLLGPGEGYRLPRGGLILDGYSADKQEPDVLLLISAGKVYST